jgi:prepilin-type N-terminal cleavage/methylation domain-containing protein
MKRKGFTLVELAVVIVIIGVLAAFGVPRFRESVERSKASEAYNYLSAV